ncbi:MAG TPA: hypothetical protein VIY28_08060 [Pseudonocardiaceae bacterium]
MDVRGQRESTVPAELVWAEIRAAEQRGQDVVDVPGRLRTALASNSATAEQVVATRISKQDGGA